MKGSPRVCTSGAVDRYADATGRLASMLPPGPERDDMLALVRLGVKFKQQHRGRRRGHLHAYISGVIFATKAPATFEALLDALELAAARRALRGEAASSIEKVDRVWDQVTFHDPRAGRKQITFGRLRNIFTAVRKEQFPTSAKP